MKAWDAYAAVFDRSGTSRNLEGGSAVPAASPRRKGRGAPSAVLTLVLAIAALALAIFPAVTSAETPVVSIDAVASHSIVTAEVSGSVDANEIGTEWWFQVSTDGSTWNDTNLSGFSGGPDPEAVPSPAPGTIQGLKAGTSYEVRLFARNFEGEEVASSPVSFETDPAVAPTLTVDPPSAITSDSVHLSGSIDPEGGNEDAQAGILPISWQLQLSSDGGSSWNTAASGELTGADAESNDPVVVEGDAAVIPNADYQVRLLISYAGLTKASPEPNEEFSTPAIAPDVFRETLWEPTSTSIQLNAQVNPHNAALTDCHFEYGTGGAFDHSAPCESPLADGTYSPPSSEGNATVAARISGLVPGTEYSFKLVATNAAGTGEGAPRSFTTLQAAAPESCSNEAIRSEQHAKHLPDCRAWEMATPLDKGNSDIVGDGMTTVAAKEGGAVSFSTRSPFGDTVGSGKSGQTQYLARRGADGWTSHSITPRPRPDALQTLFAGTRMVAYSEDLRSAVTFGYDLPDVAGDTPARNNYYFEDTATRALQPITTFQGEPPFFQYFFDEGSTGVSDDARHVALMTPTALLPDVAPNVVNVYQWDEGTLTLAGVLPSGATPEGGSEIFPGSRDQIPYRRAMSQDGTRLFFTASQGGPTQLYLRIDGSRTVWVSQPEGSEKSEPTGIYPAAMTADGRNVFFVSSSPLLDEDKVPGPDLYRYTDGADPTQEPNLTLVSQRGDMVGQDQGGAVVGVSDDGQRVYYVGLNGGLDIWDHGAVRVISRDLFRAGDVDDQLDVLARPGYGRVSSDGRFLAFGSRHSIGQAGVHGLTGQLLGRKESATGEPARQLYLYDLRNDTLRCVSCGTDLASEEARVTPNVTKGSPVITQFGIKPRFLADDGRVFFSTRESLTAQDRNEVFDAYQYDPTTGIASLLSSGKGKDPSSFADASASGDEVFIATRQPLASGDSDDLVDLYDVRTGGGFPTAPPTPAPCIGEGCQGASSDSPPSTSLASGLAAKGNLRGQPPRRCPKGKRKVRRQGKVRCVSRGHKHHRRDHKRANSNRRAAR